MKVLLYPPPHPRPSPSLAWPPAGEILRGKAWVASVCIRLWREGRHDTRSSRCSLLSSLALTFPSSRATRHQTYLDLTNLTFESPPTANCILGLPTSRQVQPQEISFISYELNNSVLTRFSLRFAFYISVIFTRSSFPRLSITTCDTYKKPLQAYQPQTANH